MLKYLKNQRQKMSEVLDDYHSEQLKILAAMDKELTIEVERRNCPTSVIIFFLFFKAFYEHRQFIYLSIYLSYIYLISIYLSKIILLITCVIKNCIDYTLRYKIEI